MFDNKRKKAEAELMAPQWLKISQDCVNLINTTTNPEVFFKRYDLCIETVQKLVSIEKYVKFQGKKPRVFLNELLQKRDAATKDFIMRCYEKVWAETEKMKTKKGKINKVIKLHESIEMYVEYLSKDNLKRLYDLRDSTIGMLNSDI